MPAEAQLDELMPTWHWRAQATAWLDAAPDDVFLAFEQVTLSELPFAAAARRRQAKRDRSGLTMLHDLLDQGFFLLYEEQDVELVLGRVGQFWRPPAASAVTVTGRRSFLAFDEPGYAKAAFGFRVCGLDRGTMTVVETRVSATDERTHREFNRHWLVGSWADPAGRKQLVDAVRKRAEDPRRGA